MSLSTSQRLVHLDALRGFALLGILVMNVQLFAMPAAAYSNPTAYGDLTGGNLVVWWLGHLLFNYKFMSLFSLLFGAGIVLFAERAHLAGNRPARLHYRRMTWLLVFGLAHAYLLWCGDILVSYALCGMLVYPLRGQRPWLLLTLGLTLFALASVIALVHHLSLHNWPLESYFETLDTWAPDADDIAKELAAYRGGYWDQMRQRAPQAMVTELRLFFNRSLFRVSGLMLMGMALFKLGILQGARSPRFYGRMLLGLLPVGLAIVAYGARENFRHGWVLEYAMFGGYQYNYWGSLLVALGLLGGVMWIATSGYLALPRRWLEAVGQTAFSNYILQSVIGTGIFYGTGLGLFGSVSRVGQLAIVVGVWLVQLVLTSWWLTRFVQGPLEWSWRALTYGHRTPFRRAVQ